MPKNLWLFEFSDLNFQYLFEVYFSGESIENCVLAVVTGTNPTLTGLNFGYYARNNIF